MEIREYTLKLAERRMLEEATTKTRGLRAELEATEPQSKSSRRQNLAFDRGEVARDLRAVLGRDVNCARLMLSRLLGEIILRPAKDGLGGDARGLSGPTRRRGAWYFHWGREPVFN